MSSQLPELKRTPRDRMRSSSGSPQVQEFLSLDGNQTEGDVSRQLSVLKHRKKQAANDAQLLLNRIALLQKEEERARRKIEQTKDRASDILSMRDENYKRVERFVRSAEEEAQLQNSLHEKNLAMDTTARETRLRQIHKVLSARQESVKTMRERKKIHEQTLLSNYEQDLAAKQQRRDAVKYKEEVARLKKLAMREAQEQKKHDLFLAKAAEQEREARKAEQFVQMLEQKEKDWFNRLQQTQQVQENAYVYLENALMQEPSRPQSTGGSGAGTGHGSTSGSGNVTGNLNQTSPLTNKLHHSTSIRQLTKLTNKGV